MIKQPTITTLRTSNKVYLNIVRGIPGSGKTTLAKEMSSISNTPSVVLSADMYFNKDTGNYDFDREKLYRAHGWCLDTTKIFLQDGVEVFVANTFVIYKEIKDYFDYADQHDFGITLITANNDFGSVHNVPEEAMERFRNRIESHDILTQRFTIDRFIGECNDNH